MYRLRRSHPHRGRGFLPAAGAALQPVAEVFPTQGQWQLELGGTEAADLLTAFSCFLSLLTSEELETTGMQTLIVAAVL